MLRSGSPLDERVAEDLNQSRIHGLQNIEALAAEWSRKLPIPEETIRVLSHAPTSTTTSTMNALKGMRGFFPQAAETGVLPGYDFSL